MSPRINRRNMLSSIAPENVARQIRVRNILLNQPLIATFLKSAAIKMFGECLTDKISLLFKYTRDCDVQHAFLKSRECKFF